jgi:hypothetical protein
VFLPPPPPPLGPLAVRSSSAMHPPPRQSRTRNWIGTRPANMRSCLPCSSTRLPIRESCDGALQPLANPRPASSRHRTRATLSKRAGGVKPCQAVNLRFRPPSREFWIELRVKRGRVRTRRAIFVVVATTRRRAAKMWRRSRPWRRVAVAPRERIHQRVPACVANLAPKAAGPLRRGDGCLDRVPA